MADGHLNKCRSCTKKDTSANYRKNISYYKIYDRVRNTLDHRRKRFIDSAKKFRRENPQKYRAHNSVANALMRGTLKKEPCIVCGNPVVDAHHHDYSKPLEVTWVCRQHHHDIHRNKIVLPATTKP